MPPLPGEETLLTLFADVHYYFSNPTAKPVHHRFEKGSYVYLHRNNIQRRGRLEIANNAGTAEQDAFDGHLDDIFLQYSYKHDTLFTLTIEGRSRGPSPVHRDIREWHIPGPDQHNQGRYMLKIHTLDMYFWTKEDAHQFLDGARRILPESQMRILDAPVPPPPTHQDSISTVVQKLEHAAISDPSYTHAHRISQSGETSAASTTASPVVTKAQSTTATSAASETPVTFAPMAYNPSAPAAPEPIAHREKTPPPPDMDNSGTGLGMAAAQDQYQSQYGQQQQPMAPHGSFPPPPPQMHGQSQYGNSTLQQQSPHGSLQRHQTFAGPPPSQSYNTSSPGPSGPSPIPGHLQRAPTVSSFPPPPPGSGPPASGYSYGQDPNSQYQHGGSPPPQRAHSGQYGMAQPAPAPPHQQHTSQRLSSHGGSVSPQFVPTPSPGIPAQPPTGGYSNYQYGNTQAQQGPQPGSEQYNVHQQLYRPTQVESQSHVKPSTGESTQPSRLTGTADKVGKGLGGLLKKVEKKIG